MIRDQQARRDAINHERSFIVQAPAGSGKTELLTQRVLKLLSVVENPEEIVAITFTRKAAREMQNRIIESLYAALEEQPIEEHKILTWQLANQVLERDRYLGWGLLSSPQRLQIKTFDSLCASLANQMPVLANFGGQLSPTNNPMLLYQQAAKTVIDGVRTSEPWAEHVYRVLAHTDNKVQYLQDLLAQQLAKRDQWLRLQSEGANERAVLEQGFSDLLLVQLKQLDNVLTKEKKDKLLADIIFASDYFDESHELAGLKQLTEWPEPVVECLPQWKLIISFCLTKQGKLRASGQLPPQTVAETKEEKQLIKARKEQSKELFNELKEEPSLDEKMSSVANFPDLHFQEGEWEVIESLTELMQVAAASLKVEFKNSGEVDYTEIAMAASRALGDINQPSELALKLDYSISHILVDEFQDTSFSQFNLVEQLTAGWQPDDGRTLFVVGDPMQSIYRFREANVGLFIQAREHGIGDISLDFLQLTSNFRSSEKVVNWVNKSFEKVFPNYDDPVLGAVTLAQADATQDETSGDEVEYKLFFDDDKLAHEREADYIASSIEWCLKNYPEQDIAVLVRARNHGEEVIQSLRERGIPYVAEEFEQLEQKQPVLDLLTLLRILLHPLDKVAWIALFKSPWFGLSLSDITLLVEQFEDDLSLVTEQYANVTGLSQEARTCLERQVPVLKHHLSSIYQQPLAIQLESFWLQLGGALALDDDQLEQLYTALDFISDFEQQTIISDYHTIEDALSQLFSPPTRSENCRVSIMTMHKSKGLEFDTVFLPRLDKKSGANDKSLMVWEEFPTSDDRSQYLLAPVDQAGELESLYKLVSRFSKEKDRLESARLLYVAATRAKRRLYLTGCGKSNWNAKKEEWGLSKFDNSALMSLLAPIYENQIQAEFMRFQERDIQPAEQEEEVFEQGWLKLMPEWKYQAINLPVHKMNFELAKTEVQELEFDWATDVAKTIGILIHRQLELIANKQWQLTRDNIEQFATRAYQQLKTSGYDESRAQYARERLTEGLLNVSEDDRARWILQPHREARCELALTGNIDGDYKTFVIDRTFVDEGGTRWIIDYKSGSHLGDNVENFIRSEVERYQPQLENYRELIKAVDDRPVKTALYFPMLKHFELLS
ncbi:UvrD-helicase domain-containing protein [Kangiella sediminilitoris]|uniref:DNA 3'-5' helicase n=1 Tax=Kangiella sediminilitoris TaxID=1144748 RepID=A0A1B3BC84_9GAMM|nr:UvrD-helicase domain-containing protein [Kangiella sediminilitoris]AOE50419.1 UvrD/REP helicase [Kangiella sediminilitoris]